MNHYPHHIGDFNNATIRLAIVAAGGAKRVSEYFRIAQGAVSAWHRKGIVPSEHILELGGGRFTPQQILEAVTATKRERQACEAGVE